jgi:hypothetical protein
MPGLPPGGAPEVADAMVDVPPSGVWLRDRLVA